MLATLARLARRPARVLAEPVPVVLPPWERAKQPDFVQLAAPAVLAALAAADGAALSTQALFSAVARANPETPPVLVLEPYGPDLRKPSTHAPATPPPYPDRAIRSITHFKRHILPALAARGTVQKVHRTRALTEAEVAQRLAALSKAQRKARGAALGSKLLDEWLWVAVDPARHVRRAAAQAAERARAAEEAEAAARPWGWEVGVGQSTAHLSRRRAASRVGKVSRAGTWVRELEKARAVEEWRVLKEQKDAAKAAARPVREAPALTAEA